VDRGKPSGAFVLKGGIFQAIPNHAEYELSGLSLTLNKKAPGLGRNQGQRWAVQLMTGTAKKWISQRGFGFNNHNATM